MTRPRPFSAALTLAAVTLGAMTLGAVTLGAAPAKAQEGGPYVGVRALAGLSDGGDLTLSDGTAMDLDDDSLEWSTGASAVVGWRFDETPFRAELEYIWRYRFDIDAHAAPAGDNRRLKSNIDTHSVYLNGYVDIPITMSFRGYVGAGVGFARHNSDTQFIQANGVRTDSSNADSQLSWMATAGVQYDLSEAWSIDASYRYTDLGEIETASSPIGSLTTDNYYSHDFLIGVAYRF